MKSISFLALGVALPTQAIAQDAIPDIAQALLDSAYETGDAANIEAVAAAVKDVFPDYAEAIDAQSATVVAEIPPPPDAVDLALTTEETPPPQPSGFLALKPWEGKIQAGASFASGNSDNAAVGLSVDAARAAGAFTHNINAYIDVAESDGETNQKRWGAAYKLDYNFSERTYAFGRVSFEEDQFSGYSYRLFTGAGLGHFIQKSEPFTWSVEAGPGYRYSPLDDSPDVEEEFAIYGASQTDWLIREGVLFEQDFFVTWTSPTTTLQSITALTTNLTEALSTGISFEYRYETDPPAGTENEDITARATLSYGF
ncbi:MAG: DUF481 domain-containing protein [Pseudomonadota bacterium]